MNELALGLTCLILAYLMALVPPFIVYALIPLSTVSVVPFLVGLYFMIDVFMEIEHMEDATPP